MSGEAAAGRRWTREELVAALSLYARLAFGKFHRTNPGVVALATRLDRTPSSVAMKLCNFASLDPAHQRRNVQGLANASRSDRAVWDEFHGSWADLALAVADDDASMAVHRVYPPRAGMTEVAGITMQRRGQAFFRAAVLAGHRSRCCITGIEHPELLRASHIIPWSDDATRRLDPRNGLCLSAFYDAAFDRGLMAVSPSMSFMFAAELRDAMPPEVHASLVTAYDGRPMREPERYAPDADALAHHRETIFRGAA